MPGVDIEQVIGEVAGEIDPTRFEQAWHDTMVRHAALRTGFVWADGGEPCQWVIAPGSVALSLIRQDHPDAGSARRSLEQYLAADRRVGFPGLKAPLLRVALIRGGGRTWFVTTYHHLILDARGMSVMFREVLARYAAPGGGEARFEPAAGPYRRYLEWLATLDEAAAEKFWRCHLEGFTAPTSLNLPRPAAGDRTEAPVECGLQLGAGVMSALRATAEQQQVSVNTLVQAAWAILLHRYTGADDIVFGGVRGGRRIPIAEADQMLGLFINTVPVRVRLSATTSVVELLRQLRSQWREFRPYEHTPLLRIQSWSGLPPGQGLFDTLVSFQDPAWDAGLGAARALGSEVTFFRRSQPSSALALDVTAGPELRVRLVYDPARFAAAAVSALLGHFGTLLEALATGTQTEVARLPLLSAAERQQVLVEWNQTARDYPRHRGVHELVSEQAAANPTALAVAGDELSLTYGELDRRANQLAHRLRAEGVERETLVAVAMERCPEMIVAWLGILKAGGAFVPIDPAYPEERIVFQLEDCAARLLLTRAGSHRAHFRGGEVNTLEISGGGVEFAGESSAAPDVRVAPEDLAYVIFTSGSTGRPKGVPITHRSLMNLVAWHQSEYAVTAADRATQLASPAFDASVWEIWPYLASGASVHIPPDDIRVAPAELLRWLARQEITLAFMPTPLAESALNESWPAAMRLRAILTGGDKLKRRPPGTVPCALVNHYGPTECTVVATSLRVEAGGDEDNAPAIGRPIANIQAYVLDAQREPVPVGVPGELYLGGDGLSRGYLRRPELTAARFVTNPFGPAGSRLYRTGDLVRWTAAGTIEFIGRLDAQVKVRGCRIEPGEIEAALQSHGDVREALVLTAPDFRGEPQLAGYVVLRSGGSAPGSQFLDYLRARLPAYMVPATLQVLEKWPLTPNGKIDRRALPAVASAQETGASAKDEAPAGPVETAVAEIYQEVLHRPAITRAGNFFDLGGHSLLAAQVISRLNRAFPVELSVRVLFDHPTVAGLAREVQLRLATQPRAVPSAHHVRRRASQLELVPPN